MPSSSQTEELHGRMKMEESSASSSSSPHQQRTIYASVGGGQILLDGSVQDGRRPPAAECRRRQSVRARSELNRTSSPMNGQAHARFLPSSDLMLQSPHITLPLCDRLRSKLVTMSRLLCFPPDAGNFPPFPTSFFPSRPSKRKVRERANQFSQLSTGGGIRRIRNLCPAST